MSYYIYLLVSPSEKYYVGISKDTKARLTSHVRLAREGERHPLYDAMRKYGATNFKLEILASIDSLGEARATEVTTISVLQACDRRFGYNLSAGGEYDCIVGPKMFWASMRANPVAFEAYRAKLRAAQQKRAALGLIKCPGLIAFNAALSARERRKRAHRASRMARRTTVGSKRPSSASRSGNSAGVRAAWEALPKSRKVKHARACRERAKAQWANRTSEERADVSSKISRSVKALHADPLYHQNVVSASAKGRANMDRKVQGAAASKGLKNFWTELRKDPERYAAYLRSRSASLKATLKVKGFICKE